MKKVAFQVRGQVGFPDLVETVKGSPSLAEAKFSISLSGGSVTTEKRKLLRLFDLVTV